MNIEFIEKDQLWQEEQTNYWFAVDEENYCIADRWGERRLLDCDGCPMEGDADHDKILAALLPHYEAHIKD